MIVTSSCNHFAVTVIGFNLDNTVVKLYITVLVKFHYFAVQVGTKNRIFDVFLNNIALLFYNIAYQLTSFLRSVKLTARVATPKWAVTLSSKAQIPNNIAVFLFNYRVFPKFIKKLRLFHKIRLNARIRSCKNLSTQRFCMVMSNPQSHIRRHLSVQS